MKTSNQFYVLRSEKSGKYFSVSFDGLPFLKENDCFAATYETIQEIEKIRKSVENIFGKMEIVTLSF
jgi:hypothetical protein